MKNYKESYYGDDIPGKGNVAYDGRHDSVEVIGFTSTVQKRERLEDRAEQYKETKKWHQSMIKDLNKKIRQVNNKIK